MDIKVDIDYKKILKSRGFGRDRKAARHLANLVAQKCDKRVPMQTGVLKNNREITGKGSGDVGILYKSPYAHYQYYGKVMAGRAPKRYTGKAITYNQAPMRGSKWDVRTMQAEGDQIVATFAKYVGGKPK